jgi:serine protease AprX
MIRSAGLPTSTALGRFALRFSAATLLLAAIAVGGARSQDAGAASSPPTSLSAQQVTDRAQSWLSALPKSTDAGVPRAPTKVLVSFRHGAGSDALAQSVRVAGPFPIRRTYTHLPLIAATLTTHQITALAADPDIAQVSPDVIVHLTPVATKRSSVPSTWYAPVSVRQADPGINQAQTTLGLDGDSAHDGIHHYSKNDEVIAIVDTGVDGTQPDLAGGKILDFQDFVTDPSPGCPPAPNPLVSWDAVGHGTLVASEAAGAGVTNKTMAGVAPGAALVVLKVFDCTASAPESTIAAALDWLLSNHATYGVDVVNMSFGFTASGLDGTDPISQLTNQLAAAGIVPVVAAGNNGPTLGSMESPGVARWALTAGAEKANSAGNDVAEFSSRGPTADGRTKPDVLTPGVDILGVEADAKTPSYVFNSGTSFSAPFLSGLAALALEANPSLRPSGTACDPVADPTTCPDGVVDSTMRAPLTDLAHSTASDWGAPGPDDETGWGVLHAWPFLAAADHSNAGGPHYPQHVVREGTVPDLGESLLPITVRAHHTVTVGLTMPSVNPWSGPFYGLFALDGHGSPVAVSDDCASAGGAPGGSISGLCYPYGSASRAVGISWTPTTTGTAFIGVRSLVGATSYLLDIDGADAAATSGIPVHVSVSRTPLVPGGSGGLVSVSLGGRPAGPVHVRLYSDGGLSFARTAALTFTPTNWNETKTVAVEAVPQSVRKGDPHGTTLVAIATGNTIDDAGSSIPLSVEVLDAASLPAGPHTERVSLTNTGTESWGQAYPAYGQLPFVSSDGSVVAFASRSTDLTGSDPNGLRTDIFVRDRTTGETEKITPDNEVDDSYLEGMSADGRYVLFSTHDAITPGDTNNSADLFVKDRSTGTITRVNLTSTGAQMPTSACSGCLDLAGSISANGKYVTFVTDVPMTPNAPANGPEVYERDLQTGTVTRVSIATNGANGVPNVDDTWAMTATPSADGSVVLFSSASDGLAPGALPGQLNIYAHVVATGKTILVNSDANGQGRPVELGTQGVLSANGLYAAFETYSLPSYYPQIYVKNLTTGAVQQVNVTSSGGQSFYNATLTSISGDGRIVAFATEDPTIGGGGMVMRNLDTGVVTPIAPLADAVEARISPGADYAVWDSSDPNLVSGDTNMATDTFWRQIQ